MQTQQPPIFLLLDQAALAEQSIHYVLLALSVAALFSPLIIRAAQQTNLYAVPQILQVVRKHNFGYFTVLLLFAYYSDAVVYPYYAARACELSGIRALDWTADDSVRNSMDAIKELQPGKLTTWHKSIAHGDLRASILTGLDSNGLPVGYIVRFGYGGIRAGRHAARIFAGERYTYSCGNEPYTVRRTDR